jgi:NADH-quinone oxidoreductase subunit C
VAGSPGPLPATEITRRLRARFGEDLLEATEAMDQAAVRVGPERYRDLVHTLRDDAEFACDYCDFVSAVDRGEAGFDVVTQLWSIPRHHGVRIKVACSKDDPTCPSISDLYPGANWHEREAWELFGIRFEGHPQLVKLLLPEQFEGHPLRKDFVLMSRVAKPWPGEETTEEGPPG